MDINNLNYYDIDSLVKKVYGFDFCVIKYADKWNSGIKNNKIEFQILNLPTKITFKAIVDNNGLQVPGLDKDDEYNFWQKRNQIIFDEHAQKLEAEKQ